MMRSIGNYLKLAAVAGAIVLYGATNANASSVTFDLNCTFSGSNPGTCTSSSSFGTVTLSDHAMSNGFDYIDISVALDPDCTLNFDNGRLYLNYAPGPVPGWSNGHYYDFFGTGTNSVTYDPNDAGPNGYGWLDISINPAGNNTSWSLKFGRNGNATQDLLVSMFNIGSNDSHQGTVVYAAAYIECDRDGGCDDDSYTTKVGSLSRVDAPTGPLAVTAVPEPASLVLLGTGLVGAAALRRRSLKRQQ